MSGFLYFIEGIDKPVTLDDARAAGLGYAFDEPPQSSPLAGRTPTGAPGMLVWSQARIGGLAPGYYPDAQEWEPVDGQPGVHVGLSREAPPTPEALRRPAGLDGEPVALGDGREWIIPRLSLWNGEEGYQLQLPMFARRRGGQWVSGGVAAAHQHLARLFERLYAQLKLGGMISTDDCLDAAVELLAVNYYLGAAEAGLLGLLVTDESLLRIVNVALDWDTVLAWLQKKSAAASPTDSAG